MLINGDDNEKVTDFFCSWTVKSMTTTKAGRGARSATNVGSLRNRGQLAGQVHLGTSFCSTRYIQGKRVLKLSVKDARVVCRSLFELR